MKRPASVTLVQALISPDKNSLELGPSLWSCLFSVFVSLQTATRKYNTDKAFSISFHFLAKDFACIALISFGFNFVHF